MITDAKEMSYYEQCEFLRKYADDVAVEDLTEDQIEDTAQEEINKFLESELYKEICENYADAIDLEDEDITIVDVLNQYNDIIDDSDMFPNGRDYDAENYD